MGSSQDTPGTDNSQGDAQGNVNSPLRARSRRTPPCRICPNPAAPTDSKSGKDFVPLLVERKQMQLREDFTYRKSE